jgi:hypothetical protein
MDGESLYDWSDIDKMKEYPESFELKNCDYWKELAELVQSYSGH